MTDPRYPIGKFQFDGKLTPAQRVDCIRRISEAPQKLREVVSQLTPAQLDKSYREGGWTARQLVHHLADGQYLAYFRTKLAVIEDNPVVNNFEEDIWIKTADMTLDVGASLDIISGTHARWAAFLSAMRPEEFERPWRHPHHLDETRTVDRLVAYFTWHIEHHTAHIDLVRRNP